jgi:hypothetical protein
VCTPEVLADLQGQLLPGLRRRAVLTQRLIVEKHLLGQVVVRIEQADRIFVEKGGAHSDSF